MSSLTEGIKKYAFAGIVYTLISMVVVVQVHAILDETSEQLSNLPRTLILDVNNTINLFDRYQYLLQDYLQDPTPESKKALIKATEKLTFRGQYIDLQIQRSSFSDVSKSLFTKELTFQQQQLMSLRSILQQSSSNRAEIETLLFAYDESLIFVNTQLIKLVNDNAQRQRDVINTFSVLLIALTVVTFVLIGLLLLLVFRLKRQKEKLFDQAVTDALTKIYNRRYFNDTYAYQFEVARRQHKSLALVLVDIDYFKLYNDYYGHSKGDATLFEVATIIKSTLKRKSDIVCRIGGEEFACIINPADTEDVARICKQICENVQAARIPHQHSNVAQTVTVSVGYSVFNGRLPDDSGELFNLADRALYEAKEKGRNRVFTHYRG